MKLEDFKKEINAFVKNACGGYLEIESVKFYDADHNGWLFADIHVIDQYIEKTRRVLAGQIDENEIEFIRGAIVFPFSAEGLYRYLYHLASTDLVNEKSLKKCRCKTGS